MRKIRNVFFIFLLALSLGGCSFSSSEGGIRMIAPHNQSVPLQGKWEVIQCMKKTKNDVLTVNDSPWIGKKAEFSDGAAMIGDSFWLSPGYKIRMVDADEYFLFGMGLSLAELNFRSPSVDVITLTSEDKFLYEFIKTSEDRMVFLMDDNLLFLKKSSDKVDENFEKLALEKQKQKSDAGSVSEEGNGSSSGILLGLRSPKSNGTAAAGGAITEYGYRTLWIALSRDKLHPVLETQDLLLPRKNGFWKIGVSRASDGQRMEDILNVSRFSQTGPDKNTPVKGVFSQLQYRTGYLANSILYAGNDYISLESRGAGKYAGFDGDWKENRLAVMPVDGIQNWKAAAISDVAGQEGLAAFKKAKEAYMSAAGFNLTNETKTGISLENFGIARRTGHWLFKGRISYQQSGNDKYADFNVNMIPASQIVSFDTLYVTWTAIKEKVPEAVDAYTSPGKDMVIILTGSKLFVYTIHNGVIDSVPLKRIKLLEGDTVVMAEWSRGDYVQRWERVFLMNKTKTLG